MIKVGPGVLQYLCFLAQVIRIYTHGNTESGSVHPALPPEIETPCHCRSGSYTFPVENEYVAKAWAHRQSLTTVRFIAITGSCGKTTTKDLAAGLLAPTFQGSSNPGSGNCGMDLVDHLLRVEPDHDFCIQELGAWGPATLDTGVKLVAPHIGVVLNVRRDHYAAFHGLEHTQAEKAKVIESLPDDGAAILNAGDPYVWEMRSRTRARVVSFGSNVDADFRMQNVRSNWPERLSFDLWWSGECRHVRTQLIGEQLAGSAAAAIAIAHTMGVPLDQAVERIAQLMPTERRMSSIVTGSGIAVVRDDFKATSDSLPEFLRFLECARAQRKVAVVGRISDYPGRSRSVYTSFAKSAARIVDLLIFVGERPDSLWGDDPRESDGGLAEFSGERAKVRLFRTVRDASHFLRGELRRGDLLALKGSGVSDHLERIVLEHLTTVQCWRDQCGLNICCDSCGLLGCLADTTESLPAKSPKDLVDDGCSVSAAADQHKSLKICQL